MATSVITVNAQALVDLGKTRVGEQYVFGATVPKDNANWHGPWDCAEFTSWLVFQTTGRLYGCQNNDGNPATADAFTGYYDRDARSMGGIISVNKAAATPGAFLLRLAAKALPGHVVVCDGMGGTIEAHSHNDGVIQGTIGNRRRDFGILVPWIKYDDAVGALVIPRPQKEIFRVTNPMIQSDKVGEIQRALLDAGFDPQGMDNIYGEDTAKAVVAFQQAKGLLVDGEVGEQTAAALGVMI